MYILYSFRLLYPIFIIHESKIMTHNAFQKSYSWAGSREKACCGKLGRCACRRSNFDIASTATSFSGNFSSGNMRSFFKFGKCREPRCKIKCSDNNMLMPLNNFKGSFNQGSFSILTDENLNCRSKNVVYLITCKVCSMQYVGETSREFGVRMREHWDKIRRGDTSQLIYAHFQSDSQHKSHSVEDCLRF